MVAKKGLGKEEYYLTVVRDCKGFEDKVKKGQSSGRPVDNAETSNFKIIGSSLIMKRNAPYGNLSLLHYRGLGL